MRLILMTLSITVSALVFAWRTDMLTRAQASPALMGQTTQDGLMAKAMAFIAGTPGGPAMLDILNQDNNIVGTPIEVRNGMLDQAAVADHIDRQLQGFGAAFGGTGQPSRTPAMIGSKGAKFVSVEDRN